MAEIRIKVGSVTNAQKGKKVLTAQGIGCVIERSFRIQKGEGCGYVLVIKGEKENALKALKRAGIRIISVE